MQSLSNWTNSFIQVAALCVFPLGGSDTYTPDSLLCLTLSSNADTRVGIPLRYFEMKKIAVAFPLCSFSLVCCLSLGKMIISAFLCRLCKQCVNLPVQLTYFQFFPVSWIPHLPVSLGYLESQTKGIGIIYHDSLKDVLFSWASICNTSDFNFSVSLSYLKTVTIT